jgi:hypothetical protein
MIPPSKLSAIHVKPRLYTALTPTAAALSITHLYKSSVHTSKVSVRVSRILIPTLGVDWEVFVGTSDDGEY